MDDRLAKTASINPKLHLDYLDQLSLIKNPKKTRCGHSSVDFSFSTQPNLDFKPSVDAKIDVEEDGTERFEKGGV